MSIRDFIDATKTLTKEDFKEVLDSKELQGELQNAMLTFSGGNPYEWMREHEFPWRFWAFIYQIICKRMTIKATLNTGHEVVISPTINQMVKDGVTFLQGPKPMEGLIGAYKNEKIYFAHAARDVPEGQGITSDDLQFIELDENGKLPGGNERTYSFRDAEQKLDLLIQTNPDNESKFQEYFCEFPWVFGLQYNALQSHKKFDDQNIPDFSAARIENGLRDIVEIKPPGLKLFGRNNAPLAALNASITQCERYIDFADQNRDYLDREKGLRFNAPIAMLVAGWNIEPECLDVLRRKERLNPRIKIKTYNDLRASIKSMSNMINVLHATDKQTSKSPRDDPPPRQSK